MSLPVRAVAMVLGLAGLLAGCGSPEATRVRGGGPGADTGNHGSVVQLHDGAEPYWRTPRRLARDLTGDISGAREAERASRGVAPSASHTEGRRR